MCDNTTTAATLPFLQPQPQSLCCALCPPSAGAFGMGNLATTCIDGVPLCRWCARPIAIKRLGVTDNAEGGE